MSLKALARERLAAIGAPVPTSSAATSKAPETCDVLAGIAALPSMAPPPSMTTEGWRALTRAATAFAAALWPEAAAAGWSVTEIFGIPPGDGKRRDRSGLIAYLPGRSVGAITAEYIELRVAHTGSMLRYRRSPNASQAVALWRPQSESPSRVREQPETVKQGG